MAVTAMMAVVVLTASSAPLYRLFQLMSITTAATTLLVQGNNNSHLALSADDRLLPSFQVTWLTEVVWTARGTASWHVS